MDETVEDLIHPQVLAFVSGPVDHGWKPIHYELDSNGRQIVSWIEPTMPDDTELTLRIKSNDQALETNEMMSTLNKIVIPLTKIWVLSMNSCFSSDGNGKKKNDEYSEKIDCATS